jgi:hypothetical protein
MVLEKSPNLVPCPFWSTLSGKPSFVHWATRVVSPSIFPMKMAESFPRETLLVESISPIHPKNKNPHENRHRSHEKTSIYRLVGGFNMF